MNADCMKTRPLLRWDTSLREQDFLYRRGRKGIGPCPERNPRRLTLLSDRGNCVYSPGEAVAGGWLGLFLARGRPVFVFLKGRNGWLKMAGCRLVHALLRRNGEDVWQCVFYLKPENGLLLHRCAFRPEKRRFQKPSFVRLTKCHRTDRSRSESGWEIIVNRRNRPTWQTCKTSSQTSPCWDILSETPIFVCLKGKLYLPLL